jgi:hypothetical protein
MKKKELELLLADYFSLPARSADPELAVIEAALFIEQTFGINLGDDEITMDTLGTPDAIRRLVAAKMEAS